MTQMMEMEHAEHELDPSLVRTGRYNLYFYKCLIITEIKKESEELDFGN